ncbi:hypothetical protein LTR85_011693 [Meristemomyces frigidus]|nr:hypothetical protein LTR85_011693 [Meristemomyces frigidus]
MGQFVFGHWADWSSEQSSTFVLGNVLAANLPQVYLSIAQVWWTSQLTCMLAARSYDKYAGPPAKLDDEPDDFIHEHEGRPLCVTRPQEGTEQTKTDMPRGYWILTNIVWILIPWLASEAIFFAKIDLLDHWQYPNELWLLSQVGYSVLGMILFAVFSFVVFLIAVWIGLQKLSNHLPLAGTCSAAISAACHPSRPDQQHAERKVRWGVDEGLKTGKTLDGGSVDVRRCTFTSDDVTYPVEGELYA